MTRFMVGNFRDLEMTIVHFMNLYECASLPNQIIYSDLNTIVNGLVLYSVTKKQSKQCTQIEFVVTRDVSSQISNGNPLKSCCPAAAKSWLCKLY